MEFNQHQKDFFAAIAGSTDNLFLCACAGSGKTTSILEATRRLPSGQKALYLVFSKDLQMEAEGKLLGNVNVTVKTLHSFGLDTVKANMGIGLSKFINTSDAKWKGYTYAMAVIAKNPTWDFKGADDEKAEKAEKAAKRYAFTLARITDTARTTLSLTPSALAATCDRLGVQCGPGDAARALVVLAEMDKQESSYRGRKVIKKYQKSPALDFNDMIYFVASKGAKWSFPKYDIIFIDESQDLNPAMHLMVYNLAANTGCRVIGVGDPRQAIMGFAGADSESYGKLAETFNMKVYDLPVNYRCGTEIIARATKYDPRIVAWSGAGKGEVLNGTLADMVPGTVVLCRRTAPMVEHALRLGASGVTACIVGTDLGKEITDHLDKVRGADAASTLAKADAALFQLGEKHAKAGKDPMDSGYYRKLEGVTECLHAVLGAVGLEGAAAAIKGLFTDTSGCEVTFYTIHKSKGREFRRVFWLESDYANRKGISDAEAVQEDNLRYVAITRAKEELILCPVASSTAQKD